MNTTILCAAALAALPHLAMASGETVGHDHGGDNMELSMMEGDAPFIHDAYARAATPNARSGAAFMVIMNPTDTADRLIEARSDVARRVELHTHIAGDDGTMQMREVKGGFAIPAGGKHTLARGADHVMFMGLTESFTQGKEIAVTLVFENAGEIDVVIPVDLERRDAAMHGGHAAHGSNDGHGDKADNHGDDHGDHSGHDH